MFCGLEADNPLGPYPGGRCFRTKSFILDYRIMFTSSQSTVSKQQNDKQEILYQRCWTDLLSYDGAGSIALLAVVISMGKAAS